MLLLNHQKALVGKYLLRYVVNFLHHLKIISYYEQTCKGQIHQPPLKKTLMDDISVKQATIIHTINR